MTSRRRPVLAFVVVAIAFASFGLGIVVANRGDVHATTVSPSAAPVATSPAVRILIDPDRVVLLPDASLHLDLPSPPDAGAPRTP